MASVQMGPNAEMALKTQEDGMVQIWLDADVDHPNVPKGAQFLCLSTPSQAVWIAQTLAAHHGIKLDLPN